MRACTSAGPPARSCTPPAALLLRPHCTWAAVCPRSTTPQNMHTLWKACSQAPPATCHLLLKVGRGLVLRTMARHRAGKPMTRKLGKRKRPATNRLSWLQGHSVLCWTTVPKWKEDRIY